MKNKKSCLLAAMVAGMLSAGGAHAQMVNVDQAMELALGADPRIKEREALVESARALLDEATGSDDFFVDVNAFVGLAPKADKGFFTNGTNTCTATPCSIRQDSSPDGVSAWTNIQFRIIKPLYTFGKVENYADAAQGNVDVKRGDVRQQRIDTRLQVMKAYYGYLAARDTRALLEDMTARADKAQSLVDKWLEKGTGRAKQSDRYALETGRSLLRRYLNQAQAVEKIAFDGLKVLTGIGLGGELTVADNHIEPVAMPDMDLSALQQQALAQRPEIEQLEAGLRARRSLVAAKKAESMPNIYAGVVGSISYAGDREELESPYIVDPFNHAGLTPVVGVNWKWESGTQPARAAQAQAEVDALVQKSAFAQQGIPFQVAEQYYQVESLRSTVDTLREGSRSGRRWMLATYADFEAGLEDANKLSQAFQGYLLAHTQYLESINDYNLHVAELMRASGAYQ